MTTTLIDYAQQGKDLRAIAKPQETHPNKFMVEVIAGLTHTPSNTHVWVIKVEDGRTYLYQYSSWDYLMFASCGAYFGGVYLGVSADRVLWQVVRNETDTRWVSVADTRWIEVEQGA